MDPVAAGLAVLASLPGIALLLMTERFIGGEVFAGVAGK